MQIINIADKQQLNDFVRGRERNQFLQCWQWGEFQAKAAGKVIRLGVVDNEKLVAVATLVKKKLFMGKSYFYCPRGPAGISNFLFGEIEKTAKREGAIFLRFEPPDELRVAAGCGLRVNKTIDVQPSKTLILNLTKSEDELLKQMHQKTRYNIRLAEKKDIKIVEAGADKFEKFWRLLAATRDRGGFSLHSRGYYQAMLNQDSSFVKMFLAEHQGKVLAGNLMVFFGDTATYLHGGSSDESRELMAPYALQWQVIKLAKGAGYKYYDFHGIDENKWPGVTRFKRGFGGQAVTYPGTFDLIFDPGWYNIYKMVRKIRRTYG